MFLKTYLNRSMYGHSLPNIFSMFNVLYVIGTPNSAYNEVAFNEKLAITKENPS